MGILVLPRITLLNRMAASAASTAGQVASMPVEWVSTAVAWAAASTVADSADGDKLRARTCLGKSEIAAA